MNHELFDLMIAAASSAAGVSLHYFYQNTLKPIWRVHSMTGIPFGELDREKAINLGNYTSAWGSFIDDFWYSPTISREFPPEVSKAIKKNLNMNGIPITVDFVGDGTTSPVFIWQKQRERIQRFYQDPAVQAYLRKTSDEHTQSVVKDTQITSNSQPIRQLDDLRFVSSA